MKNLNLDKIIENLIVYMEKSKLSKSQLAKNSGIPISTINRILTSKRNFTVDKLIPIARALNVEIADLYKGIETKSIITSQAKFDIRNFSIGIMSLGNRRITWVKDFQKKIIGTSELEGGLDLADPPRYLFELIEQSIYKVFSNSAISQYHQFTIADIKREKILEKSDLKIVTQSYEFLEKRRHFLQKSKQIFNDVIHMPDWQITHIADFKGLPGISLVVDKGVSLSYLHNGQLCKIGGWKFPLYDLGGESWLGIETIRHAIEALEGLRPRSSLTREVMIKFEGKIEKVMEECFSETKNSDIYCPFCEPLFQCYYAHDKDAEAIFSRGFESISMLVNKADQVIGDELPIAINGSLANIYKKYFDEKRLIKTASDADKASLLTDLSREDLQSYGVIYVE